MLCTLSQLDANFKLSGRDNRILFINIFINLKLHLIELIFFQFTLRFILRFAVFIFC